jgi:hypothetical protein
MSDHRDDKLESLLRSRRAPAAATDLADRIILRARAIPQQQDVSFWRFVRDLCADFHLPKPAYVLAGALALGLVIGFGTRSYGPEGQESDATATQYSLLVDEDLL